MQHQVLVVLGAHGDLVLRGVEDIQQEVTLARAGGDTQHEINDQLNDSKTRPALSHRRGEEAWYTAGLGVNRFK